MAARRDRGDRAPAPRRQSEAAAAVLTFTSVKEWRAWLARNHASSAGVWLRIARKSSGGRSVSHAEALEVALCYGWIDARGKSHDATSWLLRFTARGRNSIWSKVNRAKAEELIRQGRMKPAGLRAIEAAKANGRWDAAYDSQRTAAVPPDLQAALDDSAEAKAFFVTLDSRNRYAILHRLQTAKKAETRVRRLAQFVRMLERKEKIYP